MDPFPRVYAILDGPTLQQRQMTLTDAAEAVLSAGIRLLQFRWKENWTADVYLWGLAVARLCEQSGAALIVNDRIDMARLLNAGAHVGQEDLPPSAVRAILGPGTTLGLSTHNEDQFTRAVTEPLDYVALGPIFGTASKLNPDPEVGVAELARLSSSGRLPVVAIGGITRENAPSAWRAGAASVAIISDLYPEHCTKETVRRRAEEWMAIANDFRH